MANEELLRLITRRVVDKIIKYNTSKTPVGVPSRRAHVIPEDLETLLGKGYQFTRKGDLKQLGQYACSEAATIRGPKGEFGRVRILGPVRKQNRIEIFKADNFHLGVKAPIRESGGLTGTLGLEVVRPNGAAWLLQEAIVALRHVHMTS